MKKDLTELVFILDKSGSMHSLTDDTIGGFNSMIERQRGEKGEALVSTVLFSDESRVIHDRVPIENVPLMTRQQYSADGCTALLDAMGDAIRHIANVHKYAREEDRPEHTVFVITTDGLENASRRYTADAVRKLVKEKKAENGWEFLFLGANIDAVGTARRYGIDESRAVEYTADKTGTDLNFRAMDRALRSIRCSEPLTEDWKEEAEAYTRSMRGPDAE